jgi:uncharacterized membrane protein
MADSPLPPPSAAPRLRFIDMARSTAILLMLEGHFVGLMMADEFRVAGNPGYDFWNWLRGIAAPLFFTVAGLVFVYLLTANSDLPFFRNPRVIKGLKRSGTLLFWGYALQLNLLHLPEYLRGDFRPWTAAFHVLQSIGVALLLLIGVFGLGQALRRIPLALLYLLAGGLVLAAYGYLQSLPAGTHVPAGAPAFLQNPFKGPHSVFPLAPWVAFSLYGGMVGVLVRRFRGHVAGHAFPLAFFGCAVVLQLAGWLAHASAEWFPDFGTMAKGYSWFHGRLAQILVILGLLVVVEHRLKIKDCWFLQVGKHTFPIYVLHVIILYGGLIGVGLGDLWAKSLTPLQAGFGALLFITFFVLMVPCFESLSLAWQRRKAPRAIARPNP